jgi:hypothetical protein
VISEIFLAKCKKKSPKNSQTPKERPKGENLRRGRASEGIEVRDKIKEIIRELPQNGLEKISP